MELIDSYRPDLPPETIFSEHTWLQGAFIASIAYGMSAVLFAMTIYLLQKHRRRHNSHKHLALTIYVSLLFMLSTVYQGTLQEWTQLSFIDWRNFPGGPSEFQGVMFSMPVDMGANTTLVISNWLCDVINVWRCLVIYRGCKFPLWVVMFFPCAAFCSSIALGTCWLIQVGTATQSPWDSNGINFTLPYYCMSLGLNLLVTLMIVSRLFFYRRQIVRAMGDTHGSQYTSLAAMIVESAAIYSAFSLLFIVPFCLEHPLSQVFIQALSPTQNLASFLIVFRVAQGKGWSQEAANTFLQTTNGGRTKPEAASRLQFKPAVASNFLTSTHDDTMQQELTNMKPTFSRDESTDIFPESSKSKRASALSVV